jgi:hypothetical protein
MDEIVDVLGETYDHQNGNSVIRTADVRHGSLCTDGITSGTAKARP